MAIIDNGSTLEPKPMLIQASAQELSDDYICIKFSQHIQGVEMVFFKAMWH